MHRSIANAACGALILFACGCSAVSDLATRLSADDGKAAPSRDSTASAARGGGGATRQGGAVGGRGGAPGSGGRTASVVLGASDVARVVRGSVEASLPISGDLRPIESVIVRSRIDGVLESVFVRDGQAVRSGSDLAKFESVEQESALRSAEADRNAAASDAETQQWNYDQSKELFKVGAIAERDLRIAQQAADAAKARLAASEARLRTSANVLRDTRVVAPFNGTIDKRKVQNGENTLRGAEMFTLVRSEVLELTATVPARRASEVKIGQRVRFSADSRQFEGRVARISPTIDPASRSITVYVQIPNPKGELKGNTFATGQIIATTVNDVLVVPQAAVRSPADGGSPYVYRIVGGQLEIAPVQVGLLDDARGLVELRGGVAEQDEVIVGNVGTLGRGMRVQVVGSEPSTKSSSPSDGTPARKNGAGSPRKSAP